MTSKNQKKNKEVVDPKYQPQETEEQKRIESAIEEINAILQNRECGLLPYLDYTPHGVIPRVQVVSTKQDEQKEEE